MSRSKQIEKVRVWGLVGNLAGQKDQEPTGKQICDIELRCHGAAEAVLLSQLEPPCSLSSPAGAGMPRTLARGRQRRAAETAEGVCLCVRTCVSVCWAGER